LVLVIVAFSSQESPVFAELVGGIGFVVSCAAVGLACLAVFQRFGQSRSRVFDSLSDNAYGMFIVHYLFVSWLQYALLPAPLSGFVKGVLVFAGTVVLSWGTTVLLRRIPGVARVI
jgi:surface polysaccharide O-acyltransferase-like enzyme